jgi:ligand-binding sensor domain-containing protein/signal transduction histidine kinase
MTDGLFRWKNQKLARFSGIPGRIAGIVEDRQGVIWVAREEATDAIGPICRVDEDKTRCFNAADGIPPGTSGESLVQDAAGNLWMGAQNLLLRWKQSSPTVYKPRGLESNNSSGTDALAVSPDGSVWVGMAVAGPGLGLERLINGVWRPFRTPTLDGSSLQVTALLSDRDGALWIGTADQGVYRFYEGKVDRFRRTDGLSSDFVASLFQDKEGTLWVVTSQGVDSFHDLSIATWSAREGLTTDNVVSVATGHDGTIWVGNAGGLDAIRHGKVSSVRHRQGLPGNQVRSVFEDRENRLWVGVDNDLTVFQNGHFRKVRRPDGSSIGPVKDITEDVQNNLWVETTWDKELVRIHNFKVQQEFRLPEIPSAHVLAADAQGNIWLGLTTGELARFRNGRTEIIHFPHATDSRVRQVIANPDGSVLSATTAAVIAWKDGKALTLGANNGLPCEGVNGLIWDSRNDLWLHTVCGLIEIEQSEMERWWMHPETTLRFKSFDVLDGAQPGNAFYQPAARSKDGRLWFANGSVLQMIDPTQLAENSIIPPVHVEEIVADRKRYAPQGAVSLPRFTKDLEIDYTALSFVAPSKVHFRYRLDGHDEDWQDSGIRRQAFYTDLRPGRYQFHVVACNNDGLWNESGAAVSFFIVPAFYQTWWFRILCVVAVAGSLCLFYLIYLKRVTDRIQAQLAVRLEERERIARELHDTLLQGFQGLMLRFQSVLKNIAPDAPARQMMESSLDRADEVLLEGRQRVYDLREAGITANSLWDNLVRCGQELARDHPTQFRVAIVGTPQPLDPVVSNEVYQMGREALTNAFRHAFADQIEMQITYSRSKVRLMVRDDGAGMDEEILKRGRSGHWGLTGMRERSQKIGAHLSIRSHGGAGTEIDLSIPGHVAYRRPHERAGWRWLKHFTAKQIE